MHLCLIKQVISYEMRSALSAMFISGAVGDDSMAQYAADTWAMVDARERHRSFLCDGRSGTIPAPFLAATITWAGGRTTPAWAAPRPCPELRGVARRIP